MPTGLLESESGVFPPPVWLEFADLPKLAFGGRHATEQEVRCIVAQMATLDPEWLKKGSADVLSAAASQSWITDLKRDGESLLLDRFVHTLYERHTSAGRPKAGRWVDVAAAVFGGDACALKLGPQIANWAEVMNRAGANRGIEMLICIGTDAAISQLDMLARKVRRNSVKQRAQAALEAVAAGRQLTLDELADRTTPDGGLSFKGERFFDYGPRKFSFGATPDLKLRLRDEEGRFRTDLPALRATDDPVKAAEAMAAWKLLKKTVKDALKVQGSRLELAMVTGRRWSLADFERFFVQHPLMRRIVSNLIWADRGAPTSALCTFRIAEDLSYSGPDDEPLPGGLIGPMEIIHPLYLTDEQRSAWGQMTADYLLVPPFDQLARAVYEIKGEEAIGGELSPPCKAVVHPMSLLGKLTRLGWVNGASEDGGYCGERRKFYRSADVTAILTHSPGIRLGEGQNAPPQEIIGCMFYPGIHSSPSYQERLPPALKLGETARVAISETLRDLAILTANSA